MYIYTCRGKAWTGKCYKHFKDRLWDRCVHDLSFDYVVHVFSSFPFPLGSYILLALTACWITFVSLWSHGCIIICHCFITLLIILGHFLITCSLLFSYFSSPGSTLGPFVTSRVSRVSFYLPFLQKCITFGAQKWLDWETFSHVFAHLCSYRFLHGSRTRFSMIVLWYWIPC